MTKVLNEKELKAIDGYFRAVNYVSAASLYLKDNVLLKRPLKFEDVKSKLIGHWGSAPGQNFIYTHCDRIIKKYHLNMMWISGPGHSGQATMSNTYFEGSYGYRYPEFTQDEKGLTKFMKHFSFPGGTSSHVAPEVPGSIHEGGELGYSLSHAFGAVLDNPDYGTSIYIRPYLPYDTELTAESIGEHLTESGIENVDQVPVYAGGEAYFFSTSYQTVTIDIAATNVDEVASYEALLLEKGYILREAYDYKIYEDAGKTIILQIALDPTDSTRAQIIIQAHDIWLADVEEMTNMLILITIFTGIVIPFPETIAWAEGTVGYDLGTTFDEKYYTYYIIFDTSFADKLGEDLVALGWAKKDAANVGFTTTYEYDITAADTGEQISYYVDILVDTEHGFSVVAIW